MFGRRPFVGLFVGALMTGVTAPVGAQVSTPDSAVFEFGSFEEHGELIHCSVTVTPAIGNSDELVPSDETCFEEASDSIAFALGGGPAADQAALAFSARAVVPDGLIAIHYTGPSFTGGSITIAGSDCNGGGITLTGGAWDNIIDSTANGCSDIEHYDVSTPGVFEGDVESTVFSGGNLSTLKNRTSGILYKGTLASKVNLVGLEVNQGIQDWEGSAQLVRGRATVVRAFFEPLGSVATPVVARLYIDFADGSSAGPLSPLNPGGRFIARPDAAGRRADFGSSLNFRLPTNWTLSDGTLRVEVLGGGANCLESRVPANTCEADMDFVEVEVPRVRVLSVWIDDGTGARFPSADDLDEQAARLMSGLPLSGLDVETGTLFGRFAPPTPEIPATATTPLIPATSPLSDINLALLAARTTDGETSVYLGVADGGGGGLAYLSGGSGSWFTSSATASSATGYARNRGVHEFAHTLGAFHAKEDVADDPATAADDPILNHTMCGDLLATNGSNGPLFNSAFKAPLTNPRTPGGDRAALGPITNTSIEDDPWGIDYRYLSNSTSPLLVIDPVDVSALMSYCNESSVPSQTRWIDMQYWPLVIGLINGIDWDVGPQATSSVDTTLFSGTFTLDNDIAVSAEFAPTVVVEVPAPATGQATGAYQLELLDAAGVVVYQTAFDSAEADADASESGDEVEPATVFVVRVDNAPAYETARVVRADTVLASLDRTPNPPVVTVAGPTAGEVLSGDKVTLSWSGSDVDGDELSYLVQYSIDGGATFKTIAVDLEDESVQVNRALLEGSTQTMFRVTASDGTQSTSADSAVFTVAQNAPRVTVVSPSAGGVYTDLQAIVLEATATDNEDGPLDGDSIVWSSDVDGPLGTGSAVVLDSAGLTPGVHVVTVTVTDSAGAVTSKTIQITAGERNLFPVAVDDDSYVELGDSVDIDVLDNDFDAEDDIDESSLSIVTPPALGSAVVQSTADAGSFIRYTAGTGGSDTFTYEVCDSNGQCATASVTVAVGTSDCTIVGTNGADTLIGTDGDDVICGLRGNDTIDGRGGNDVIRGGRGADVLKGGAGDDVIRGGRGKDTIRGQAGQDTLFGGPGQDTVFGGGGNDEIRGGRGNDTINGQGGNDTVFGGAGADVIDGGGGADVLRGNRGADQIDGGNGADELFGGRGQDTLVGGNGRDSLFGRRGSDSLDGGRGADSLFGGRGADSLVGGAGADVLRGGRGFDYADGGAGNDTCSAEVKNAC